MSDFMAQGKEILQSMHSLAELLKKVGSKETAVQVEAAEPLSLRRVVLLKEDGLKVAELHQQLSRSTTDRQATC